MRILSHYFIARYLGLFGTVLVAATMMLLAVEFVLQLEPGGAADEAAPLVGSAQRLFSRMLAVYMPDLIPLASGVAAFSTFAWAGRARETLAIEAGGVRLARVVWPVLAATGMLSLATAILHETLVLDAERSQRHQRQDPARPIDFGQMEFWLHQGRTITNVARIDADARSLEDVEIFERGAGGRARRVIRAERVRIAEDGRWHLSQARIWRFPAGAETGTASALENHAELILDLEALGGDALLGGEPGLMPLRTLAEYLQRSEAESAARRRVLLGRFHERLSRPGLVLLFPLLALPFALRVDERGRLLGPAMGAAAVLGAFLFARGASDPFVAQGLLSAAVAIWAPIGVFAGGAVVALFRRT